MLFIVFQLFVNVCLVPAVGRCLAQSLASGCRRRRVFWASECFGFLLN